MNSLKAGWALRDCAMGLCTLRLALPSDWSCDFEKENRLGDVSFVKTCKQDSLSKSLRRSLIR